MVRLTFEERWRWWRSIGSPKYVCAPMVLQSELSFRMLVRAHGTTLCYAPMLPVEAFLESGTDGIAEHPLTGGPNTQSSWFTTHAADRPLIAQLGGSDVEKMCAVGRKVQGQVDAVDINLGCPQRCAERGGYGAFLMEDVERVQHLVTTLVARLDVPVTAKIRIWSDLDRTIAFARMLEDAGIAALCVHGRRREQRHHEGPADWDAIRAIKAALRIPVISNGSVRRRAEAEACLAHTGCDAVMSATALLANPHLFSPKQAAGGGGCLVRDGKPTALGRLRLAEEYLEYVEKYPDGTLSRMISDHLMTILRPDLESKELADVKKVCKGFQHVDSASSVGGVVGFYARHVIRELEARHHGVKILDKWAGGAKAATPMPIAPPPPVAAQTTPEVSAVAVGAEAIRRAARKGQKRRLQVRSSRSVSWGTSSALVRIRSLPELFAFALTCTMVVACVSWR